MTVGARRSALGAALGVAVTSTVAVVALSQRWRWASGVVIGMAVVVFAATLRGLRSGHLVRPSSRRGETVRRWLMWWPWGMLLAGNSLWPEAHEPGPGLAVVATMVVFYGAFAAVPAALAEGAADAVTARARRMPWRRRLRLIREICAGAPPGPGAERDVRVVAEWMLQWEVVGWMSVVLAAVTGLLALPVLVADRATTAALLGGPSAVLAAVAVFVLRGCAAARRHVIASEQ